MEEKLVWKLCQQQKHTTSGSRLHVHPGWLYRALMETTVEEEAEHL